MAQLNSDALTEEERDFEAEIEVLNNNPRFNAMIEEALQSIERGETTSHAELMREFGLD